MKERAVVVFSGVSTRVVDAAAKTLQSNAIDPVAVTIGAEGLDANYFSRLVKQTIAVVDYTSHLSGSTPTAFLISAVTDAAAAEIESKSFFPALRRIHIDPAWKNNPSASNKITKVALDYFQSRDVKAFLRSVSIRREGRLLLPVENTRCKSLKENFVQIYGGQTSSLDRRVDRDVVFVRGRKAYRVNGIDFAPAENNGRHPIRDHSRTDICSLGALYRFGAAVPARVEFDITCEKGLKKRTFYQCDGTSSDFKVEPTHINMRINDDFGYA